MDFYVRRCEDPVTVDVYLALYHNGRYTTVHHEYNQSDTFLFEAGHSTSAILERNATHLAFMVSLYNIEVGSSMFIIALTK